MEYLLPLFISWTITNRCNLSCKHCYSHAHKDLCRDIPKEDVLKIIEILDEYGLFGVTLTGGEPFIRKDIFEIIKILRDKGFLVNINTNGTLIDEEKAKKLKQLGVNGIRISIDGGTSKTHDVFRGVEGAFYKALNGIKLLKEQGILVSVSTVPSKQNHKEIKDIYRIIKSLNVDSWEFFRLICTGSAKENKEIMLTQKEYMKVLNEIGDISKKDTELEIHVDDPLFNFINSSSYVKCMAGREYLGLDIEGDFRLCPSMPYKLGNIFKDNLNSIWESSLLNRVRCGDLIKECSGCNHKKECGGCISSSYSVYDEEYIKDPYCLKNN